VIGFSFASPPVRCRFGAAGLTDPDRALHAQMNQIGAGLAAPAIKQPTKQIRGYTCACSTQANYAS
jgi:hypothetical protein